jgi:hypothetical protein
MINMFDYLMGRITFEELPEDQQENAGKTIECANNLLIRSGLTDKGCRSGYRRKEDHIEIYRKMNLARVAKGLPERSIPWGSHHLDACAIDIDDTDDKLKTWLMTDEGQQAMEDLNIYCEALSETDTWLHIQTVPPHSGKRFFMP